MPDSVGARFLLVDAYGVLQHSRFDDLRAFFDESPRHSYYDLRADYPRFDTWKRDAHWDITGNRKAGDFIHAHARTIGFFAD